MVNLKLRASVFHQCETMRTIFPTLGKECRNKDAQVQLRQYSHGM